MGYFFNNDKGGIYIMCTSPSTVRDKLGVRSSRDHDWEQVTPASSE